MTAACGNNGASSPTPETTEPSGTPTPTEPSPSPTPVDPEQQLLQQIVLQAEDLPPGFTQVATFYSTNQDLAEAKADPEQELDRLETLGRLLGYDVTYTPGPDTPPDFSVRAVNTTASLYRTPEGASGSFAEGVRTARTQDWSVSYPDLIDLEVREVERPALADEALWTRISGSQSPDMLLIEDFVLLRRDRVRAFLRVITLVEASAGNDAFLEEVESWAARQVELIDAALQGAE